MTSTALVALGNQLATRLGMEGSAELVETLKQTAFKSKNPVTDAQLTALLVVANQHGLNPWTREIYAFPDDRGGIVPIVGVDGWARICNEHPQFDGVEFDNNVDEGSMTCRMYRKDRTRPMEITEYYEECKRNTDPWKNMPRRMMRNKAFIQAARLCFGFSMFDEEEGLQAAGIVVDNATGEIVEGKRGPQRKSAAKVEVAERVAETAPAIEEGSSPAPAAAPAPKPQSTDNARPVVSQGQANYLRNKLKAAGLDEPGLCQRYGVESLDQLNIDAFDELKSELLAIA